MRFDREPAGFGDRLAFVVYESKWGTAFPMWCEEDIVARWTLRLSRGTGR